MANQSTTSSNLTNDTNNPLHPEPNQPIQAPLNDGQATPELPQESAQTSVFVNSQPIREDQVQNAINFLSHPRVRGSPVIHRRNFLEKKGLTKEEIDEAFRRVPDPSPASTSGQPSAYPDAQAVATTNNVAHAPAQAMMPVTATPSGVMSTTTRRFHWSHAVYAVGLLALSGAGTVLVLKKSIIPRLKSWIRWVVLDEEDSLERSVGKPSLAEEAAAAAKAAAAAAADVARASQEMLVTKNEEKRYFAEFLSLLDGQIHEMRIMRKSLSKLEGQSNGAGRISSRDEYQDGSFARSLQVANGKYEFDTRSVRSVSPPPSTEPPHPKSYAEIMAMVQRGERPPNVRDIDDRPPNPNQPMSSPSLAPRSKPWETSQPAGNSSFISQPQFNDTSAPWWQKKNPRITEVENDGYKFAGGSIDAVVADRPPVRRWVPPQPPPVSMPEAAIAIRQPKSSIPKDNTLRAEEASQPPVSGLEELQRVTEFSETGGQLERNGGIMNSNVNISEIQEEVTEV